MRVLVAGLLLSGVLPSIAYGNAEAGFYYVVAQQLRERRICRCFPVGFQRALVVAQYSPAPGSTTR